MSTQLAPYTSSVVLEITSPCSGGRLRQSQSTRRALRHDHSRRWMDMMAGSSLDTFRHPAFSHVTVVKSSTDVVAILHVSTSADTLCSRFSYILSHQDKKYASPNPPYPYTSLITYLTSIQAQESGRRNKAVSATSLCRADVGFGESEECRGVAGGGGCE